MRGSRGGGGGGGGGTGGLKNHKNIEFLSNTGPDPLEFSKLPSQHSTLGHHRHASETSFKGVPYHRPAFSDIWILSPLKKRQSSDPDQIRMGFRKECFVNLNILACDRKHVKHQYCRISDFVVQKPMRTRSICKYHFQHRYMIFFEIKRDSYASASLSLSLSLSLLPAFEFANSLDPERSPTSCQTKSGGKQAYQELIM